MANENAILKDLQLLATLEDMALQAHTEWLRRLFGTVDSRCGTGNGLRMG